MYGVVLKLYMERDIDRVANIKMSDSKQVALPSIPSEVVVPVTFKRDS